MIRGTSGVSTESSVSCSKCEPKREKDIAGDLSEAAMRFIPVAKMIKLSLWGRSFFYRG
jgi:hypothetical protein